jgi:hypothetical protein
LDELEDANSQELHTRSLRLQNGLVNGMKTMGQGWINTNQMNSNNGGFNNRDSYKSDKPFNKFNNNHEDRRGNNEGGYKKTEYTNRYNKSPMENGFVPNQQQQPHGSAPAGEYRGGYQKNFNAQDGGYKPRSTFNKPDFNSGNPRQNNQFGDKPFQSNYMGNKPRAPFNGGQSRYVNNSNNNNEFGGAQGQKFNKFDNYKGGYGEKDSDVFQGVKSFSSQSGGRHYNNSGNRFNEQHQNAPVDAQPQQPQQFVQADAIDAPQFDSNMIPGYRMMANGQIPPFPAAFGGF